METGECPMSEDRIVDSAYDRARSRYTTEDWLALSARAITAAVYEEIRKIDAERLRDRKAE